MILLSWAITLNRGRPCEQAVELHATVSHLSSTDPPITMRWGEGRHSPRHI